MNIITVILAITAIIIVCFSAVLLANALKNRHCLEKSTVWWKCAIIGFFAYFFDALGIGSFAPTTAALRYFKQTKDLLIPGTLNVGFAVPALVETLIYTKTIPVDKTTLVSMIVFATIGGWIGASVVTNFSERKIQFAMGTALLLTSFLMFSGNIHWMPIGGNALGLYGGKLLVALIGIFFIGALSAIGIGLFAPCMAMVYLLGMSSKATFPIMMAACAFVMVSASLKFIKKRAYNHKAAINLGFFGIIGVLIATYIVKSLPITILTWLVTVIIFYVGITMIISAWKNKLVRITADQHNKMSAPTDRSIRG